MINNVSELKTKITPSCQYMQHTFVIKFLACTGLERTCLNIKAIYGNATASFMLNTDISEQFH